MYLLISQAQCSVESSFLLGETTVILSNDGGGVCSTSGAVPRTAVAGETLAPYLSLIVCFNTVNLALQNEL